MPISAIHLCDECHPGLPPPPGEPPQTPFALIAIAGNGEVNLSWNGDVNLPASPTTYNVKRSLIPGGPYTTIATGILVTHYLDGAVTNGFTYYYVVSAENEFGESANSNEASATPTAVGPPPVPTLRGVLNMGSNPVALADVNVDAGLARVDWADLETAPGVFDWTDLDAQIAAIVAAGKKLVVGVATGGDRAAAGGHKPNWLYTLISANGGTFFTWSEDNGVTSVTIPVHWDPTFLSRKTSMINAVGVHVSGQPVVAVRLNYMNAHSEDYNPGGTNNRVDGVPPAGSTPQTRWLAAGWTEAKLINAGDTTFAAYNIAFPNVLFEIAIGKIPNNILAPSGQQFVNDTVIAHARTNYPNRILVTKNAVTAHTPPAPGTEEWLHVWNLRPCALQDLWHAFNDPGHLMGTGTPTQNLTDSVNLAHGYECFWLEIYEVDVINLPAVIAYAHSLINP
jgi:hypothetical protein